MNKICIGALQGTQMGESAYGTAQPLSLTSGSLFPMTVGVLGLSSELSPPFRQAAYLVGGVVWGGGISRCVCRDGLEKAFPVEIKRNSRLML